MKTRYLFFFGFLLFTCVNVSAQLDTKHWIPPFYAKPGANTGIAHIKKHFVSLSTPATDTIPVKITNGFGDLIAIVNISRDLPMEYIFGEGDANNFPLNVIPTDSLNKKIRSQGLYFESYQPFFVNMRHKSQYQGTSLTSKGQVAKGKRFYAGHVYDIYNEDPDSNPDDWNNERRSNFISVMATQDSTVVTFDLIKAPIHYIGQTPGEPITVVLDALESYVIGINHGEFDNSSINLANGTRITSTKPIVCNSGSWLAGNQLGQCIGSDQLAPASSVGQEYILVRGLGDQTTERPIVIATADNTDVYLNDGASPAASLDEGEIFIVPTADYTANNNLYILSTQPIYVFQTVSGSSEFAGATVGLSFIPPLNCIGAKEVNLPSVNSLTGPLGQGRVNIVTKAGTSIYVNENPTAITGAQPVTGNADWVTYSFISPTDNVVIQSDSVMNVALLTEDDRVGTAGYFSGFTLEPVVGLSSGVTGTLPCIPGNAILQVFGFDSYQWYFNNEAIPGATDATLFPEFSGDYKVEGIDEACGFVFPSNSFSIPFCPSTLGAAKNVQNVQETSQGSKIFDVTYRINIKNFAISPSENIQIVENINGGLPIGATAELIGTPSIVFGFLTGGVNPAFDGVVDKKILPGTGALPGGGQESIELTIRVDMNAAEQDGYFNQVTATSKDGNEPNDGVTGPFNGQDFSHTGSNPDPNGNEEPNEEGENDPTLTCFFPNDITYDESGLCFNIDSTLVEINGISSGVFTTSSTGLALDSISGTIYPSQSTVGTHTVTFTVTGPRCPTVTSTEITIIAGPSAGTVVDNTAICLGTGSVNLGDYLENESSNGVWTDVDDEIVSDEFDPIAIGDYEFTYTVTVAPCGPVSQTFTLNVLTAPNPGEAAENLAACISAGTIDLYNFITGEQAGGQWTNNDSNPISSSVTLTEPGVFAYTYTSSIEGCGSESLSIEITVSAEANAGVPVGTSTICEDQNISLFDYLIDADINGNWYDEDGNLVNDETSINSIGNYAFTYIVSNPPCLSDTSIVNFEVVEGPSAGNPINPHTICVSDPTFNLIEFMVGATPGGVWTNEDSQDFSGIFDPQVAGIYTFTYTVSSSECGDIEMDIILDVASKYCDNKEITIPQGFSPNGDGIGDKWVVVNLEQYPNNTLLIFNRWGAEVYSASPYTNNWAGKAIDGLNANGGLPVGTYWYILDLGDGSDARKGYIYLNR